MAVAIPVGTSPLSVAADALTDVVYAANSGSFITSPGTVSVIDGHQYLGGRPSLGQVVTTIDVGRYPVSVAVDPVTDIVYVANGGSDSVSVIDGTTNKVTATIALSTEPEGIGVVPSTDMIYVALPDGQSAGTVAVINGHTNAVVGSITVGQGPWGVGVNTASGTVYVGNQGGDGASTNYAGTVSVIRGTSVVATVTVDNTPFDIGVNPRTGMAYVATMDEAALSEPSEVVVIDGQNSIVAKIQVANPIGVAVDATDDTVFVGLKYSGYADGPIGSLAVINGGTNSVTTTYSLGGNPWGVTVDPTTGRVYLASDTKPGLVYMVALAPTVPCYVKGSTATSTGSRQAQQIGALPCPTLAKVESTPDQVNALNKASLLKESVAAKENGNAGMVAAGGTLLLAAPSAGTALSRQASSLSSQEGCSTLPERRRSPTPATFFIRLVKTKAKRRKSRRKQSPIPLRVVSRSLPFRS